MNFRKITLAIRMPKKSIKKKVKVNLSKNPKNINNSLKEDQKEIIQDTDKKKRTTMTTTTEDIDDSCITNSDKSS